MNYLSVCSGVEAASVAWKGLGWNPLGFSEIEKFPSEVLNHHYPNVQNLGDMTKYKEWNFGKRSVDLLVGGTPCQSFSVAGLRKGMEDPRGNLTLTFCGILDKFRPKWFLWENVPGVLSSNKGRDFGSFLGALAELGYGASYRVLDAQNFGVPQRRRRVFVVGHLGDWKPTAEVLFESESLRWHPKKSKQARKEATGYIEGGFGVHNKSDVGGTTKASEGVTGFKVGKHQQDFIHSSSGKMSTLPAGNGNAGHYTKTLVTHVADKAPTLTSSGAGLSRVGSDTTADSQYIAIADKVDTLLARDYKGFSSYDVASKAIVEVSAATAVELGFKHGNGSGFTENGPMYTLNTAAVHGVAHTFKIRGGCEGGGKGYLGQDEKTYTISTTQDQQLYQHPRVRRLTPIEVERLQGFPDNYTNIKDNCPDGPRYKAMGNSMAVPVMRWIGERINNYKGDTDAI
jgi:DNA (cytosine-5)-methyltransferase 1